MMTPSHPASPGTNSDWEPSYEWKAVTLMSPDYETGIGRIH
jgi:hypothetical protein